MLCNSAHYVSAEILSASGSENACVGVTQTRATVVPAAMFVLWFPIFPFLFIQY